MKFGIIVFPGSNCDQDCFHVIDEIMHKHVEYVWHTETDIERFDCIILPGGFSYGDYLRCGAIAKCSPVMKSIEEHAKKGKYVLGICNGFQVLTEAKLLPGALIMNKSISFVCRPVKLNVLNNNTPFTNKYENNELIELPVAHKEGFYTIDQDGLQKLLDREQVVFQYYNDNPNGSIHDIAGITNRKGNVLGMMPHPERASEEILGSNDGYKLFKSIINSLV